MKLEIYDNIDKLHYEVLTERSFFVAECLVYVLFFIKRNKSLITVTCVIKQKLFYSNIFLLFLKYLHRDNFNKARCYGIVKNVSRYRYVKV